MCLEDEKSFQTPLIRYAVNERVFDVHNESIDLIVTGENPNEHANSEVYERE